MEWELNEKIGNIIREIAEKHGFAKGLEMKELTREQLRTISIEMNERIRRGEFNGFVGATIVFSEEEGVAILNLYKEVEEVSREGIYGFGYAYNIFDPEMSEWGYLYTP